MGPIAAPSGAQVGAPEARTDSGTEATVQTLRARFPSLGEDLVRVTLVACEGHGGRAAQELRAKEVHAAPSPRAGPTHLPSGAQVGASAAGVDQAPSPRTSPAFEDEWPDDPEPVAQAAEGVSLTIAPCSTVRGEGGDTTVMVSVCVPDTATRNPADVVCVVDISASMGSAATVETDGVATSNGLTVLDIVKHAIKTVIHMLKEGDRLAIAAFSDSARTPFQLAHMTAGGKDDAVRALDGLRPDGQTNIWAGLVAGMEALRAGGVAAGRQQTVLLLTDGRPNIVPPKGHLRELGNYKDSHPGFTFQLNTFGFGYQLNSELLLDLATEGHGTFAFIPDAAIVGTTFVDSVANTLSALSQSATLNLLPLGGAAFQGLPMGGDASAEESWGQLVRLGPLQFGQSREVVVPMRIPAGMGPYLEAILEVPKVGGGSERVSVQTSERVDSQAAVAAKLRGEAVRIGYQAIKDASAGDVAEAQETVKLFAAEVGAVATDTDPSRHHPCLMALQKDVEGRMTKALDGKQRFNRWGKHYLRALCRAHQLQLCTNFMDPGLQTYGGSLFTALRKEGDEVFLSLPLPKPAPRANWLTGSPAHRLTGSPAHRLAHRLTGSPAGGYAAPSGYAAPATPQRAPSPDTRDYYGGCSGG